MKTIAFLSQKGGTGKTTLMSILDYPMILKRIERRLKVVDMSAAAASKAAGKPDAIRNLRCAVKGERGEGAGASLSTLYALAPVLRTTVAWLIEGIGPEEGGAPEWSIRLRSARKQRGLTMVQFAGEIGIPVETYSAWEKGTMEPYWTEAALLQRALPPGVTVLWIMTGEKEPSLDS